MNSKNIELMEARKEGLEELEVFWKDLFWEILLGGMGIVAGCILCHYLFKGKPYWEGKLSYWAFYIALGVGILTVLISPFIYYAGYKKTKKKKTTRN